VATLRPTSETGSTPAQMRGGLSPTRRARQASLPIEKASLRASERTPEFRSSDRRYAHRVRTVGRAVSHRRRHRLRRYSAQGPSGPPRSKRFRSWLRRCHYEATGEAASPAAVRSALDLLEARAQFDGSERAVHIRTAEHAGRIYLDLADEYWRAVEIGPDGWRVIGSPPVRFCRPAGMLPLPLPVPVPGGSIEALSSFLP
jgi:hypothetical protein